MDLGNPCDFYGGRQIKYNKSGVNCNILVVYEENQLRKVFIT